MRVLVSCGEASGDLYAGALTAELRARVPGVEVFGLGGERFEAAGGRLLGHYRGLSATGFTAPLRVLPGYLSILRRLADAARTLKPDVFVPIDFPDFNFLFLRLASLRRLGIPVVYYISPQLWAWRAARMRTMKRHVDRVLVIFPFEEEIYRRSGVPVKFVGHPLVEMSSIAGLQGRGEFLREHGLSPEAPTIALLPGSRRNELEHIIPTLAGALPIIRRKVPNVQFIVAGAPHLPDDLFAPLLEGGWPVLVRDRVDDVLASSDVAITASGTATVQCALHERPMVVVYRLSPLEYRIGKRFVLVDTYAMPNLIAGRRVVPELIQDDFTPSRVADETVALLTDTEQHRLTRNALRQVRDRLGPPGASGRAAEAILEVARGARSA
jgi:lipid-A-disaccharide synthase